MRNMARTRHNNRTDASKQMFVKWKIIEIYGKVWIEKREKCLNKPENSEKKPKYSLKMEKDKKITNLARRLLYIET